MTEETKKEETATPPAAQGGGDGEPPKLSKNQLKKLAKGKVGTLCECACCSNSGALTRLEH